MNLQKIRGTPQILPHSVDEALMELRPPRIRTSFGGRQAEQNVGRGCKSDQRGWGSDPREGHVVLRAIDEGVRIGKHTACARHPPELLRVVVPVLT